MRTVCCLALILFVSCTSTAGAAGPTYTGEVVVRSLGPTRVAVFLDTNADRKVDKGFLLTTDIPMGSLAVHLPEAKVVFTDGYVRISADRRVYDLQVAGYPDPPAPPKDSATTTLIGNSLVHSQGDTDCTIDRANGSEAAACYSYGKG
jgi:hypothetical protein